MLDQPSTLLQDLHHSLEPFHHIPSVTLLRVLELPDNDLIADAERLRQEQENAGQKILQDVVEGEANGDAADAKPLHEIARPAPWDDDGQGHEETDEGEDPLYQAAKHHTKIMVSAISC